MDSLCNRVAEALDLIERIEMLGSAPPIGLDLEVREHEARKRALHAQLAAKLAQATCEAVKLVRP